MITLTISQLRRLAPCDKVWSNAANRGSKNARCCARECNQAVDGQEMDRLFADRYVSLAVKSNRRVMEAPEGQIEELEKVIKGQTKTRPEFRSLMTVSGIGEILGLTIVLETGSIGRFPSVGDYASYCRCVGSERISNGKRKGRGNKERQSLPRLGFH